MIVLQEIDNADSDQLLPDHQSANIRHLKTTAASAPVPTAAIISQHSHAALGHTAPPPSAHESVESCETDSAVSMSELAPSGSDFVDLQELSAPDDVLLNLMAHIGDSSAQVCLLYCMGALVFVLSTYIPQLSPGLLKFFRVMDTASTHKMFFRRPSPANLLLLV
jgi:hypothetical protein